MTENHVAGRISVIIPTYNYGHFICNAVESSLNQSAEDVEIIVVDDGSTDNTYAVLEPYKNRIKYIYQENSGLSASRNAGILKSTGEFIQFLDSDDILGSDVLLSQKKFLDKNPDVFISVCKTCYFKRLTNKNIPVSSGSWILFRDNIDTHLCYFNVAPPHAFFSRRNTIFKTGFFDTGLKACEDYDFWLRAASKGYAPHFNPEGMVYYRKHQRSMSSNYLNQHIHDLVLHNRLSAILDKNPEFPFGRRREGLLAFSAGAILTSARLVNQSAEESSKLLEEVLKKLNEALHLCQGKKIKGDILTKLFCSRIAAYLDLPCYKDSSICYDIRKILKKILITLGAPSTNWGLTKDAFFSALNPSKKFCREKLELGYLPVYRLWNSLFPDANLQLPPYFRIDYQAMRHK